ncbi:MAG: acyl-CoA dehydrogenase family protein [Candidatus Aramenus sp.]|jgi:alkylation response protein AidB-like acyl-CoA dehydrogenase|nr:acyl-CoA dehydrogenase family protein [Candidatus Aramenus sp.]
MVDSVEPLLVENVREFARKYVQPIAEKVDSEDWYPKEVVLKMGELGILDPLHYGVDLHDAMLSLLEIAKVSGSLALIQDAQAELVNAPLRKYLGSRVSDDLASGKVIGSFALSEPCCGSDAKAMRTRVRREGDKLLVNGEKMWITQGLYADLFLVFAKDEQGEVKALLVYKDSCVEREKVEVQGNRGTGTARLRFSNCVVEREVGGWEVAKYALSIGRIAISAIALGLAWGAMEEAYAWASEREVFGKKLLQHQGIQWTFSESLADLISTSSLLETTCRAFSSDWVRAEPLISALKLTSSKVANKVVDSMLQVMGGMGYAKGSRVERAYRDVRLTRIGEGSDEVQKLILFKHLKQIASSGFRTDVSSF